MYVHFPLLYLPSSGPVPDDIEVTTCVRGSQIREDMVVCFVYIMECNRCDIRTTHQRLSKSVNAMI
jgi:hypothetical protein